MTRSILAATLFVSVATPLAAQQVASNTRAIGALPTRFEQPQCELKEGHFKVSSAKSYLKTGIETSVPENRARALNDGKRVVTEAIQTNGQDKNPAAWYYLGRIHLQQGDLVGADSAFVKAEELAPNCKAEIKRYRYGVWGVLMNAGQDFSKAENQDSALALYRQAAQIYRGAPGGFYNMAIAFSQKGQDDSAVAYFDRAVSATTDSSDFKTRNRAAYNHAALLSNRKQHKEAIASFERYLQWVPDDAQAKRALAASYRAVGQNDKAQALESQVVTSAGSSASAGGEGAVASGDLYDVGAKLYADKKYAEAAKAFEQVVAKEPYNRDALNALGNSYLALKDGPKLLAVAKKLIAIEPMSEFNLRLLGQGYQLTNDDAGTTKAGTELLALPYGVNVTSFTRSPSGASLAVTLTGRAAQTAAGKAIPSAASTLVFEFLDGGGGVISSKEVAVEALAPQATKDITIEGQGAGIVGWRYKKM